MGHNIGALAQQLFPGGVDATPEDYSKLSESIENTRTWIEQGKSIIYEAAFSAGGVFAAMDILVKEGNAWRAIEVKSSGSVKEYHINDAAIQYYVLTQAGLDIADIGIMHLDKRYVREGEIELDKLFRFKSVLVDVLRLQDGIPERVEAFTQVLTSKVMPVVGIGPQCSSPFDCDFKAHCWKRVPYNNVFAIGHISAKAWQLYDQGIVHVNDIPSDFALTNKQRIEVECAQTGSEHFDKKAISEFLSAWEYPLYFFDFETINPTVPLFDGSKPFDQLPFQYSLHVIEQPGAEPVHREFLPEPMGDPRKELMERMVADLGTQGTIVAYNMGFERGVIMHLVNRFPEQRAALMAIHARFQDLIVPFQSKWCYRPAMRGKSSIKYVLPALIPELDYSDLAIQEGTTASSTYLSMLEGTFNGHQATTMNQLRAYCERDTWAMVALYRWLTKSLEG